MSYILTLPMYRKGMAIPECLIRNEELVWNSTAAENDRRAVDEGA
jgi:hypothetical protein